jgi:formylglycine-generating enzyme required for sulfatase activity
LAQIRAYNQRVRRTLDDAEHPASLLDMAIEHRLMHAETLAYALHRLPFEGKRAEPQSPVPRSETVRRETIVIAAGSATLGLPRTAPFGWDNEFDEQPVEVPAFAIDRCKVTNGDYLRLSGPKSLEPRRVALEGPAQHLSPSLLEPRRPGMALAHVVR